MCYLRYKADSLSLQTSDDLQNCKRLYPSIPVDPSAKTKQKLGLYPLRTIRIGGEGGEGREGRGGTGDLQIFRLTRSQLSNRQQLLLLRGRMNFLTYAKSAAMKTMYWKKGVHYDTGSN